MSLLTTGAGTSGGFLPTDIAGCVLWLPADYITGVSDGGTIATWSDQSGNGNDATQSTEAKKPVYKTGIVNGKPVVRCDGTDDEMGATFTLNQPYTVFVVGKRADLTHDYFMDGQTDLAMIISDDAGGTPAWRIYAGSEVNSGVAVETSNFHIIMGLFNSTSSAIGVDGAETSGNAGTKNAGGIIIGSDGTQYHLNGDIAEIIIYNAALSAGDRGTVETYLSGKYNITLS